MAAPRTTLESIDLGIHYRALIIGCSELCTRVFGTASCFADPLGLRTQPAQPFQIHYIKINLRLD
jgi:hypothetical protein